jgi:hypothetical protein
MVHKYTYNYDRYVELLKYQESLKKQQKSLEQIDSEKFLELLNYSVQIEEYLHWLKKDEYFRIVENFVNFKISGKEFEKQFLNIFEPIENEVKALKQNYEKLKSIKPNLAAFNFAELISDISLCCDDFEPNFQESDRLEFPYLKSENDLRNAVAELLPLIFNYL